MATYREIFDKWQRSRAFGDPRSINEYAAAQNKLYDTTAYDAATHGSLWDQLSTRLDIVGEDISKNTTQPLMSAIGGVFGEEEAGRRIGEGLPRMALNMLPLARFGRIAGPLATGALMGGETYTETRSKPAALVSGVAGAAMPATASIAAKGAAAFGAGPLAQYGAAQAGALFPNVASSVAQQKILAPDQSINWREFAIDTALSQIPFTAYDLAKVPFRPPTPRPQPSPVVEPEGIVPEKRTPIPPRDINDASNARLAALARRHREILADPDSTPEQKQEALGSLYKAAMSTEPIAATEPPKTSTSPEQKIATSPVTVVGRGDKIASGSYRVLVDSLDSAIELGVKPGDTVFINGAEPTLDPATGTLTFGTSRDQIKPAKFKLTEQDFGKQEDPNQLPLKLTTPERAATTQAGVDPGPLELALQQDPTSTEKVKGDISVLEKAQMDEEAAIEKANAELQSEAQITKDLNLVDATEPQVKAVGEGITSDVKKGATPDQAVKGAVTSVAGREIDSAQQTQKVSKKKLTRAQAKAQVDEMAARGAQILQAHENIVKALPEGETSSHEIYNTVNRLLQNVEKVQDPELTKRLMIVLEKNKNKTPDEIIRALNATKETAKLTPSRTIKSYPDSPTGGRVFRSKEDTEARIRELGLDTKIWKPQAGSGENKGKYYIGERILKGVVAEPKAKQPQPENPTSLSPEKLPVVTIDDMLSQMDKIIQDPAEYVSDLVNGEATQEQVLNELESLNQAREIFRLREEQGIDTPSFLPVLNEKLKSMGLPGFETVREMKDLWKRVTAEVMGWSNSTREFDLKSAKKMADWEKINGSPEDRAFAEEIGIYDGPVAVMEWLQKQSLGYLDPLVQAYAKLKDQMTLLRLRIPGDEGFVPRNGNFFSFDGIDPVMQLDFLPDANNKMLFAQIYMHELTHYFDRYVETRQDAAAVKYREVRKEVLAHLRASKAIPAEVKKLITHALKTDLMGRWQRDEVPSFFGALAEETKAPTSLLNEWQTVIYGLMNEGEMIATIFNSPKMIGLMRNTSVPKGGVVRRVLDIFSEAWAHFWQLPQVENSALSKLLDSYDNYLSTGALRDTYGGVDYTRAKLIQQGTHPDAMYSRLRGVERLFSTGKLRSSLSALKQENQQGIGEPSPINTKLLGAILSGDPASVGKATSSLTLDELPAHQNILWRLTQDMETVGELRALISKGAIPGELPANLDDAFSLNKAMLNAMRVAMQKQTLAVERMQKMDMLTPEGWQAAIARQLTDPITQKAPDEVPDAGELRRLVALEHLEGKQMSWLAKTFALAQHLKELYPSFKAAVEGIFDEAGHARQRMRVLQGTLLWDPTTPDTEGHEGTVSSQIKATLERVAGNERLTEGVSDLVRWINKQGKGISLNLNDPFVKNTLGKFNKPDQEALLQVIKSLRQRHDAWTNIILPENFGFINREYTAQLILALEKGIMPEVARDISNELYSAIGLLKDPQQTFLATQRLQALQSQVQPTTYFKMLAHAQRLIDRTNTWLEKVRSMPGWVSETRFGKNHLIYLNKAGKKGRDSGTREKLLARAKEIEAEGGTVLDYIRAEDAGVPRYGIQEDILSSLDELDVQNEAVVAELLKDQPDLSAQILPLVRRGQSVRDTIASGQPLPKVSRQFAEGRQYLNMFDNANQYYEKMNNWFRHKRTRARVATDKLHPEVRANSEVSQIIDQHQDNFLTPDSPVARKFVETTYFAKLGFDFGNSVLESIQNLTTGMASLVDRTGSVGDAFGLWQDAVKEIGNHFSAKKWSTPEISRLMEKATNEGLLENIIAWQDLSDPDSMSLFDKPQGPVGKGLEAIQNGAKKWSSKFVGYNNKIALIAGFKLGRQKGLSFEDSYKLAVDAMREGLYVGGKAQRSIGLYGAFGPKARAIPQVMDSLQTYVKGWLGQMAVYYKRGFGKPPPGTTEAQRAASKKAFLYMLGSQVALAGVLGLPGVGQGLALLQQTTGVDVKGWLKANIASLAGEDEKGGGLFTSLALRGVGAAGLPFDPSGRASLSIPYIGVDPYKGFSVGNLGGAVGATVEDFVQGLFGMLRGEKGSYENLVPNALRRPIQLWEGQGDIRDARGTLLQKLSPAERFWMTIGLTPSSVQASRDTSQAYKKMNERLQRQKASLVDGLAVLVRQGKTDEVKSKLAEMFHSDPNLDVAELIRTIAARVEAQTVPFDYRRELPSGSRMAGLGDSLPSTEALRQNTRRGVETSLGLNPTPDPQGALLAHLMDQLMDSDPFLTRAEARRIALSKVRVLQRNVPGWLAGSL